MNRGLRYYIQELKKNGGKDRKNRSAVTSRFRRTAAREFLPTILEAMRDNMMLTFSYKPFWVEDDYVSSLYHVEPYALKVFKRRWYLLGKYGGGPLKVYALDRILDIDIEFEDLALPANFNAAEFFGTCFGIIVGDEEPQLIRLKVDAFQSKYLRAHPLQPFFSSVQPCFWPFRPVFLFPDP